MSSSAAEATLDTPAQATSTLAEQQAPAVAEQDVSSCDAGQQASSCTPPAGLDCAAQDASSSSTASTAKPRVFKMSDEFLMFKFKIEMCSRKDRCVRPCIGWRLTSPAQLQLLSCICDALKHSLVWVEELGLLVRRHDWKICPYAHPGEVARRRHPRGYTAVLCPAKTAVRPHQLAITAASLFHGLELLAEPGASTDCSRQQQRDGLGS